MAKNGSVTPAVTATRGAGFALGLLLVINLFNYIDRQVLSALVPAIRAEFFADGVAPDGFVGWLLTVLQPVLGAKPENALIGLLAMAFMVSYMIAAPIFGLLRIRRWWIIAAGVCIWSLACGASGLATAFGALLLTRCLLGVGEAAFGPIAPTVISELYPESQRGRKLSLFYLAIPVGSAIGFAYGGLMGASELGWRWAFYLVVIPGVILSAICLFMKEPPKKESKDDRKIRFADLKTLARTPSYVYATLGMAAMTFAIGAIGFWMPSYVHEFRGQSNLASVSITFGGILVLSGLAGTIAGGFLADRMKAKQPGAYFTVSGIAMLLGLPFFIAALYVPFPYAWICLFMSCFGVFFNTGPMGAILANVTHPVLRPTAYAVNIFVIHALGDVISPLIIGAITDATGSMNIAFMTVAATVLVSGVLWIRGAKFLSKDTDMAETRFSSGS